MSLHKKIIYLDTHFLNAYLKQHINEMDIISQFI